MAAECAAGTVRTLHRDRQARPRHRRSGKVRCFASRARSSSVPSHVLLLLDCSRDLAGNADGMWWAQSPRHRWPFRWLDADRFIARRCWRSRHGRKRGLDWRKWWRDGGHWRQRGDLWHEQRRWCGSRRTGRRGGLGDRVRCCASRRRWCFGWIDRPALWKLRCDSVPRSVRSTARGRHQSLRAADHGPRGQ